MRRTKNQYVSLKEKRNNLSQPLVCSLNMFRKAIIHTGTGFGVLLGRLFGLFLEVLDGGGAGAAVGLYGFFAVGGELGLPVAFAGFLLGEGVLFVVVEVLGGGVGWRARVSQWGVGGGNGGGWKNVPLLDSLRDRRGVVERARRGREVMVGEVVMRRRESILVDGFVVVVEVMELRLLLVVVVSTRKGENFEKSSLLEKKERDYFLLLLCLLAIEWLSIGWERQWGWL